MSGYCEWFPDTSLCDIPVCRLAQVPNLLSIRWKL